MSESATKGQKRSKLKPSTQSLDIVKQNVACKTREGKKRHRTAAVALHSEGATAEVIFNTPPTRRQLG